MGLDRVSRTIRDPNRVVLRKRWVDKRLPYQHAFLLKQQFDGAPGSRDQKPADRDYNASARKER
jgi:hypothetical protein